MATEPVLQWDDAAATFDEQPDHGLRDQSVRLAWDSLLRDVLGERPLSIVDLGCGTGTLAVLLAQAGHQVTGVDFSTKMLVAARAKAEGLRPFPTFVLGDAANPPLARASVDLVLSRHVLWAMPDPVTALTSWTHLLRPGGVLVLIEGRWSTGAGLTSEQCERVVRTCREEVEVVQLDDPELWGHPIDDERYLLISRR